MPLLHRHAYVALLIAPLAACLAVPAKGATPAGTLQRNLPRSFRWSSTGSVISPQQDGSAIGSDGNRYYRSFTSHALSGSWRPPSRHRGQFFARSTNVTFPGGAWTKDISHGELIRAGNDQTMTVDLCRLQLLYQGRNPNSRGE
ncbi:non-reducing end alpha-L-arabinofuranosidase family hydrolase [Streptomyces sp. NPDC094472]|uniref:non-reducing end alpha-L-arabinofuranosidase family hydrolase n=1 Tax=Streptomyces sp. NPDC094472 TaxID=3155080 RepID=UPI00332EAFDF